MGDRRKVSVPFVSAHPGAEVLDGADVAAFIDRALVLDPNLAVAWGFSAWTKI